MIASPLYHEVMSKPNPPIPPPQMAPEGFDSVCGTEKDQKVLPVQAAAGLGDKVAAALLEKGKVYGKQFNVI